MRRQRGYINITAADMLFGLAAVGAFFIGFGVLLSWLVPKVWGWAKPWLHAVTG